MIIVTFVCTLYYILLIEQVKNVIQMYKTIDYFNLVYFKCSHKLKIKVLNLI